MKVASIIAEYNPFHQGHLYHLNQTKLITDCDYLVVIMSGNYTQRGEPAIFDKYFRAHEALLNGADLVLELPSLFSTASAESFAFGAVSLAHKLGVCTHLSFGSETGDTSAFREVASFLNNEPEDYQNLLQTYLKSGNNYPAARSAALKNFFPLLDDSLFLGSNNILALEYCRAIQAMNSSLQPLTIQRLHNNYNDNKLAKDGLFSSATAIRNAFHSLPFPLQKNHLIPADLRDSLPESFFTKIKEESFFLTPLFPEDFSPLLHYRLLRKSPGDLLKYLDINRELADRIYKKINDYSDWESFCHLLKTKEVTHTRIRRCLLHLLLSLEQSEMEYYKNNYYCPYAKVLGFRKTAAPLLHQIKRNSSLPLITKNSKASLLLSKKDFSLFEKECINSHIYNSVLSHKYHIPFQNEYTKTPIMI